MQMDIELSPTLLLVDPREGSKSMLVSLKFKMQSAA
jgi:hypothetical protein